jgi:hypothetical protein
MNSTTSMRFVAALGVAAAAAVTPALLFVGAGTAQADACYGELAYSYYCSPASGALNPEPVAPAYTPPSPDLWSALPQCTGGVLAALGGEC